MTEARIPESTPAAGNGEMGELCKRLAGKYMTFKLGQEEYGLEILKVRELIGLMAITRVPRTAHFIRGVINLRGRVIPVVDLRMKFGMSPLEATDQTVIIVVQYTHEEQEFTMGILVDEVLEVRSVSTDQIEPTPNFGSGGVVTDFILGVGKTRHAVIFLLDIGKVLSAEDTRLVSDLEQGSSREEAESGDEAAAQG